MTHWHMLWKKKLHFTSTTCVSSWVMIASLDCLCPLWLATMITLVLVKWWHLIETTLQCAKKVMSDNLGLVDFAVRLVNSQCHHLLDGHVKFLGKMFWGNWIMRYCKRWILGKLLRTICFIVAMLCFIVAACSQKTQFYFLCPALDYRLRYLYLL